MIILEIIERLQCNELCNNVSILVCFYYKHKFSVDLNHKCTSSRDSEVFYKLLATFASSLLHLDH